jgi:flagellar basal body P-ring formation protein FlgA
MINSKTKLEEKQTRKKKLFCALFLFLCFVSLSSKGESKTVLATVRVKNETVVKNDKLTLGNIAEISSNDSAIGERLSMISLGYSPNVGAVRELPRERILMAISSAGFSSEEFSFESPAIARVRRESQRVESNQMRVVVEDAVLSPLKTIGATAQLIKLDIPASIDVPTGEVEVRTKSGIVKDLFSPFSVSIEILVDGRVVKRISAMAQVEAMMPVIIAARDIQPNERIKETDVQIETRKLEKVVTSYFRDFSKLRGADASRPIAKGEIITNTSVVAGLVVKAGDHVRIVYQSGKMQIAVKGEAKASGRIGERIQIKNLQSGILLQAIIVDEGLVQVN